MASEGGQDGECQEKFILKRKLTGPPRLLLGKSKSMNQGVDRSEDRTKKRNKRENINCDAQMDSSDKPTQSGEESLHPVVILDNLNTTLEKDVDQASSEKPGVPIMRGSTSEVNKTSKNYLEGHSKIEKSAKRGWRRIFSPALICVRRQKKYVHGGNQEGVQADRINDKQIKSAREDSISLNDKCVDDVVKRRRRLNIQTLPAFKQLLAASYIRRHRTTRGNVVQEVSEDAQQQQQSATFRKRCQHFLMCGRKATSAVLLLRHKDTQVPGGKEAQVGPVVGPDGGCGSAVGLQEVEDIEEGLEVRGVCTERVTVSAEVSILQPEHREPDDTSMSQGSLPQRPLPTTIASLALDPENAKASTMNHPEETDMLKSCTETGTDSVLRDVFEVTADATEIRLDKLKNIRHLEKEEGVRPASAVINTANGVAMDTNKNPLDSNLIVSSENVAEDLAKESGILCTFREAHILQNDPLVTYMALDGHSVAHCSLCKTNSGSQNDNGVGEWVLESCLSTEDHPELQLCENLLVQTARLLVQAAISTAVEQLSMEQRGTPTAVHREAQECRDHA